MAAVAEEEQYKTVLIVRQDLGMSKGKIAAQCCHAALGVMDQLTRQERRLYAACGDTMVVVKCADLRDLLALRDESRAAGLFRWFIQEDAGRTQVTEGAQTVLAVFGASNALDRITYRLKLL